MPFDFALTLALSRQREEVTPNVSQKIYFASWLEFFEGITIRDTSS